ncbi:MAG: efflux RND transporter permease subunit [Rhodospirillaceae bacterium]|nr:efflux RND transporter permease subunit [Rhodospirillaceae bacterium]
MNFTDIFVKRPVLASVVSLAILVLGLRALGELPVQQYPHTESSVVTVTTSYYGADPDVVAGFITTPLEQAIAQANGIDYMTSASQSGLSSITVNLRLNYDANEALTEINTKVNSVLNALPPQSQQPVLAVSVGMGTAAMYMSFSSNVLPQNKITDYLVRIVQPKLQAIEGVQTAEILGGKNFALRAWLDPAKLASYNLTAADVQTKLAQNDFISGIGSTRGQMTQTTLTASTGLHTVEEFEALVVKQDGDAIVRLKDVAKVTLGSEDYESNFSFDGKEGVSMGINLTPGANLLDVAKAVRDTFPDIQAQLPAGLIGEIAYDNSMFVNAAITEVIRTLIEALLIVTAVVFAFMGSPRAVFIPVVAMPLSLVGTLAMMLLFGFTINLLTLLALVLAIGLVVDDAIIVVENVQRHLEDGMKPIPASIRAARELGGPIIAMTVVLAAVYVPVGFQGGLTGTLFKEFAMTLVGAVTISAIIALTLSPMMCSRMLRSHSAAMPAWEKKIITFIDTRYDELHRVYMRMLRSSLKTVSVTVTFAAIILGSIYFLYTGAQSELAPAEDESFLVSFSTPATNATIDQRKMYGKYLHSLISKHEELDHMFQIEFPGQSLAGLVMKPWDERDKTTAELQPIMQNDLNSIPGTQAAVFLPPSLPGTQGLPIQFSLGTTQPFAQLNDVNQAFLTEAMKSGMFIFLNSDLKINRPQSNIEIDRNKAAQLGLTMSDIGNAMSSMLGGGYVNYFSIEGRSYKVIPQVQQGSRLNVDQLLDYHIRAPDGTTMPLSTIAKIETKTVPESLNHFQQLNSATIQGIPMPGVTLGASITYLKDLAARTLPKGYFIDYGGQARQYVQESSGFIVTFAFALIVIYLSLAALFESFRDPVIILISVPMSIAGALIFIAIGSTFGIAGATLNIYTQVGLVTLMGLISKHGILIVEFANEMQKSGKTKLEAIEAAASIRLRPILMTTAAMVFGVLPLITATGAGAASRFSIGLVIASGISIGTLFTLFVVPAVYVVLAADHHAEPAPEADAAAKVIGG